MIIKQVVKNGKITSFVMMLFLSLFMINEMSAQSGKTKISGVIIDDTGMPIPGANVIEKGTKNSVSSDFDGKYSINISSSKSELIFSFIGYESLTQSAGQKKTINAQISDFF